MSHSARLPGYGLELPSIDMIRASLGRYLDEDEATAVWDRVCASVAIDMKQPPATADELLAVVDAIESCGELAAVCAKGLRIRIMSWAVLARASHAGPAPAGS